VNSWQIIYFLIWFLKEERFLSQILLATNSLIKLPNDFFVNSWQPISLFFYDLVFEKREILATNNSATNSLIKYSK